MRLRLRCVSAYDLGDLQWTMVHVPEHCRTVRDFAAHISRLLELGVRGGNAHPPRLLLEGFLVPHDEEVRSVLRDDEVVDVEPCDGTGCGGLAAIASFAEPVSAHDSRRPKTGAAAVPAMPALPATPASDAVSLPETGKRSLAFSAKHASVTAADTPSKRPKREIAPTSFGEAESARVEAGASSTAPAHRSQAENQADNCGGLGLFVGGLSQHVDDAVMRSHFTRYGEVSSAEVMINRNTDRSKGFGFVEFVDAESCARALADKAQQIGGKVVEVKPRQSKGPSGEGKGKGKDKGKDKGSKGKGKGKGSHDKSGTGKSWYDAAVAAAKPPTASKPDSSSSSSSDDDEVTPAPKAGSVSKRDSPKKRAADDDDVAAQMAALGLPVSFTANMGRGEEASSESEDEEEE